MKIAVIAHAHHAIKEPYVGGLETHTHQMVKELIRIGHDVTLFAKFGSDKVCNVTPIFWGNACGGNHPLYNNGYHVAMLRIAMSDYDLIINNSLNQVPLKLHDASFPPMITIFHTPPLEKMTNALRKSNAVKNRVYIAVSSVTAKQWQPFVDSTINVVPNGIRLDGWLSRIRPHTIKTAAWMGRITPEKGTHIAIEACIKNRIPLIIGGSIYDKTYYKEKIRPLLKNKLITYAGHINQKQLNDMHTQASVALVTPMWEEPFGLVAIEALASGTPVATLPNGALPHIVKHNVGAIAQSNSVDDFAHAITVALSKDRATCRSYVHDNYTLEAMVSSYLQLAPAYTPGYVEDFVWQT